MAITVKKEATAAAPVAETQDPLAYLGEVTATEVKKLPEAVQAKFREATELTPELIEAVAADIPETLMETLITDLEQALENAAPVVAAPAPAPAAAAPAPERQARRDALKAQIAANANQNATVPQASAQPVLTPEMADAAPTMPEALNTWNQMFPIGMAVTVVNRGAGKFELHIGGIKEVATVAPTLDGKVKKERKPSVQNVAYDLMSDEYFDFLGKLKADHPTLADRVAYAESLGLVRGTDWAHMAKTGQPLPEGIENMYMLEPIRKKLGIEKYIEEARDPDVRKAIARGEQPMPAGAKHRKRGTGEVIEPAAA